MLEVRRLALDGVVEINPRRFRDARGYFSETWSQPGLAAAGIEIDFVQDNQSLSLEAGTVRGLHYQAAPLAQDKLVRVLAGSIFDVAVDLRPSSRTFGQWLSLVLTAKVGNQLLVPKGFAHGFMTLEPDTLVSYKVSAPYSAAHERSIHFADPTLAIAWPRTSADVPILSDKDALAPLFTPLALEAVS